MTISPPNIVLDELKKIDLDPSLISELDVRRHILKRFAELPSPTHEDKKGSYLEADTFYLVAMDTGKKSHWNTHFTELWSGKDSSGVDFFVPDIRLFDREAVEYWEKRSDEVTNPILKARYSDLVWDLKHFICKERPNIRFATIAIDSYIATYHRITEESVGDASRALNRALELAISINDLPRIKQCRELYLDLLENRVSTHLSGIWCVAEELLKNKKIQIEPNERGRIVAFLERILSESSNKDLHDLFNPHSAETAGKILETEYKKDQKDADAERVIRQYCRAFEQISETSGAIVAVQWLTNIMNEYRERGLKEDAKRVHLQIQEKSKAMEGEMKTLEASVSISQEEIDGYLSRMTDGTQIDTLRRICHNFCPRVDKIRQRMHEHAQKYPFQALVKTSLIDNQQVTATLGALEDDEDGRLINEIQKDCDFQTIFLDLALKAAIKKHGVDANCVINFIKNSPLFSPDRETLVREGIEAHLNGDFVKAVHVLIPQIEHSIRLLLPALGIPSTKQRQDGTFQEKNINDILYEARVKDNLDQNVRLYFISLLADPRGGNYRNKFAHGLMDPDDFDVYLSNRIFHMVLLLGILKRAEISEQTA